MAQHSCLQPGEFVTEAGSSSRHLKVVPDQLAAAVGEDGPTTGKACAALLAGAGGKTPDESTVRGDVAQDRVVAASGKLADRPQRRESESRRAKEDG